MKSTVLLFVAACVALPRHAAFAQAALPQPGEAYATSELDRAIESLPPNFNGHDIALVYSALKDREKEGGKSEFETKEQWHQRQEALLLAPVTDRMTTASTWAFVIEDVRSVYDADNQVLQVYVPLYEIPSGGRLASNFRSMWAKFESADSSYIGTNGFGAVAKVHNTEYTIHSVAFGNARSFPAAEAKDEHSTELGILVEFLLGPDAARRMKRELSALSVCRLTAPFTWSDYSSEAATVSSPYATQSLENYVITELLEVWIYNRKSGAIYAKVRPHD
jgi:hypothetical protein